MSAEPEVDLIIAVHTAQRAIERAVGSVLAGTVAPVRVTVVCHGVDPALIEARLGDLVLDPRLRLLPFADGIPSPTGPFNHGLDAATAPFTAILGSDDELLPAAIDSWLAVQRRYAADVVIPRVGLAEGPASLRTPPTRPFRSRDLDGAKDRLAYRTQQLGLVSRARFPDLRMTPGLTTGEDIEYGLRLWFSGARIAFDRTGPAYWGHQDATDRISVSRKGVAEDFRFLDAALEPAWVAALSPSARQSIAIKFFRAHLLEAMRSRFLSGDAPERGEREALAAVTRRVVDIAPEMVGIVSIVDRRLLTAVMDADSSAAHIAALLRARAVRWRPSNLISASPARLLHREAPVRFFAALALTP